MKNVEVKIDVQRGFTEFRDQIENRCVSFMQLYFVYVVKAFINK